MSDLISRQAAIDAPFKKFDMATGVTWIPLEYIEKLPSAQPEIVLCGDCLFGHIYFDIHNNTKMDSWVECTNPYGLYRDVSCDDFCSYAERREDG